ncbi:MULTISPECIES: response regulator transcription factor [Vibrio]|jgi:two-component system response regulator FimZ (fimbrial Z protein)|uniref:Response regulator transcription factor n=2 Tax=Vibrio campbellii TaxID=680 RepID=A0AAQ2Y243_9VIBR|nr:MULTISPECIES: response regulator transcription factor [Vibrio]EDL70575.1 putative fimbrial protein Z, transcriptional regulator [Vibrio campbellii HY01]KGR33557.1 two component transcriptional regulator [Vibrio campbellii]MCC8254688.1 response regulator transcription factor [Vibrio campbellii CAIM 333]MDK9773579.1 response regulator transcription factor [Vibrio sp. B181a]NIY86232.1 response regulator transcription factor [Vibrio campbellii]
MNNVLIIDDQPLYSEALASLVQTAFQSVNVVESTDSAEVMDIVRNQPVDLVILDVVLGDRDGMRLAKNILATGYQGKILFISSRDYSSLSKAAFEMGAHGFLNKNEAKATILDAIVSVTRGYSMFKATHNQSSGSVTLSNREAMVFHYLAQGYSNKKISEQLSLSAKTISTYKTRILKKYHAESVVELLNTLPQEECGSLCC